jgi:hypothetical protein
VELYLYSSDTPSWHGLEQLYLYPALYGGQAYVGVCCVPVTTTLKQDRQCTYNITLMQVHATIVAVEKQLV